MPSLRELRRRIRSVQNTAKITKAMSMIAAAKMRRAQEMALSGRPYADRMQELVSHLAAQLRDQEYLPPLLQRRDIRRVELVLITPDRGLTGGLHTNLNRQAGRFLLEQRNLGRETSVITVGRKGRDFIARTGQNLRAVFTHIPDRPPIVEIHPIARLVMEGYISEEVDAVYLLYARFISTTVQRPVVQPLLPVEPAHLPPAQAVGYIYEPNVFEVLAFLLPRYVELQVYRAVLEAQASEHSARMVAMRNATDNANEMVHDLTLVMNKVRQETITKEILDIVGGVGALEE